MRTLDILLTLFTHPQPPYLTVTRQHQQWQPRPTTTTHTLASRSAATVSFPSIRTQPTTEPPPLAAFNHGAHQNSKSQYDRLRQQARDAHAHGDHSAGAHYNKQASEFIFRENNAPGRVASDTIDLHGQFVNEAEDILEERIRAAKARGETHLHVIVGKGNHSPGHIQKIKPKVEAVCRDEGLRCVTEENEGRVYIDLRGGGGHLQMPPMGHVGAPGYQYGGQHGGYQAHQGMQYGGGGGYPGQPQQQMQQDDGRQEKDALTRCIKSCCVVM